MSSDLETTTDAESRDPLEEVAESFLERLRRGERPSVEEYVQRHPHLAGQIQDLFPTLLAMEHLGPGDESEKRGVSPVDSHELKRLGEYRILREIGRGGMGIVYEAEQETLGRRVALKVLPFRAFSDEVQLERFRQEARAAARLHHTNIVPVFGVGADDGVHYYAMQYIHGQSLADVLTEVRKLRAEAEPPKRGGDDAAADVAVGLVSGEWRAGATTVGSGDEIPAAEFFGSACGPTRTVELGSPPGDRSGTDSSENPLGANSSTTSAGDPGETYYRSVARVGLQVADALSYAHGEGVLHRDIKPSNLLLDMRGVVWVTDFGLAKAEESSDLTASGNVVGTLRYLAPERLRGDGDARSDIYSLGITLYELLTLRPAHAASDRARLIQEITTNEPVALRKVDPRVPRDLETVVLKAIAREPQDRYRSARALADDLRRFIDFEPIAARRATIPERLVRWCQRNPTVAALSGAVAALVVTLAIGGVISAGRLHDRLMAAKLEEGRAWRRSGQVGQRTKSLEAFREAAVGSPILPLRNEIIASLALTDLVVADEWDTPEGYLGYDQFGERFAVRGEEATTLIFERESPSEPIAILPGAGSPPVDVRFSPSAHYVVVKYAADVPSSVWNVDLPELLFRTPRRLHGIPLAFSPDETFVAAAEVEGTVVLRSLPDGREIRRFEVDRTCQLMKFAPDGRRLAIAGWGADRPVVLVFDTESGEVISRLYHERDVVDLAWHPEGELLATACFDFNAHVWEANRGRRAFVLRGHLAEVTHVVYSHDGRFLATSGWDNQTFLWPADAPHALVSASGMAIGFRRDSLGILYKLGNYSQGTWRIEGDLEHRLLHVPALTAIEKTPGRIAISPDGRWLVAGGKRGVRIWSLERPAVAAELTVGYARGLAFDPRDGSLLTGLTDRTLRWPVRELEGGAWSFGPPEQVVEVGGRLALDARGRILAVVSDNKEAHVYDLERAGGLVARFRHGGIARIDVSSSGDRVVTGTWHGQQVRVWNVASGELEKAFEGESSMGRFSPDDRWLAVSRGEHTTLYETGTWRLHFRVPRERGSDIPSPVAFTADSRFVGISPGRRRFAIYAIESGEEVATLEHPDEGVVGWSCFSRDGSYVAMASEAIQAVRVWNLRAIRERLEKLSLNWSPPLDELGDERARPREIHVDYGKDGSPSAPLVSDRDRDLHLSQLFSHIIELEPSASSYAGRADVLERLGDPNDAIVDLGRAIALAPADDTLLERRGRLCTRLGRWEEALHDFDRVVSLRRARFEEDASLENGKALRSSLEDRAAVRSKTGDADGAASDRRAAGELLAAMTNADRGDTRAAGR